MILRIKTNDNSPSSLPEALVKVSYFIKEEKQIKMILKKDLIDTFWHIPVFKYSQFHYCLDVTHHKTQEQLQDKNNLFCVFTHSHHTNNKWTKSLRKCFVLETSGSILLVLGYVHACHFHSLLLDRHWWPALWVRMTEMQFWQLQAAAVQKSKQTAPSALLDRLSGSCAFYLAPLPSPSSIAAQVTLRMCNPPMFDPVSQPSLE